MSGQVVRSDSRLSVIGYRLSRTFRLFARVLDKTARRILPLTAAPAIYRRRSRTRAHRVHRDSRISPLPATSPRSSPKGDINRAARIIFITVVFIDISDGLAYARELAR